MRPRPRQAALLNAISAFNDAGHEPTKAEAIRRCYGRVLPNRTRAYAYRAIDQLIAGGHVEGNYRNGRYHLRAL